MNVYDAVNEFRNDGGAGGPYQENVAFDAGPNENNAELGGQGGGGFGAGHQYYLQNIPGVPGTIRVGPDGQLEVVWRLMDLDTTNSN